MSRKYYEYMDLLQQSTLESTQSMENWSRYLDGAARNFKYSFGEQLLINSQKPGATAIADYDTWTQRLGRVVKTGTAMYIPIVENGKPRVKNYFDISDTIATDRSPLVPQWGISVQNQNAVLAQLTASYDLPEPDKMYKVGSDLENALNEIYGKSAGDYLQNNIEAINTAFEGGNPVSQNPGTDIDEEFEGKYEREQAFEAVVYASVATIVNKRLGIGSESDISETTLNAIIEPYLPYFNTEQSIIALGNAVSNISEECLRTVETAVRSFDREQNKIKKERESHEQRVYSGSNERDSLLRAADGARDGIPRRANERGRHDVQQVGISGQRGNVVHDGADGRERPINQDAISEHSDARTVETALPLGHGADGLPQGTQQVPGGAVGDNRTAQALPGNRGTGHRTQTEHDGSHSERPGEHGNEQRQERRPDGVGTTDEQLPSTGTRNDLQRPDLRIVSNQDEPPPQTRQITQDEAPIDLGAFSMQKIPPMFVVDWEESKHDFDLNLYDDRDMVAYDQNGVSIQVGKMGNFIYTTTTTGITPLGDILGDNNIPSYIRSEMRAYRNGDITAEQVRDRNLERLAEYKAKLQGISIEETENALQAEQPQEPAQTDIVEKSPTEYPQSISHSPLLMGWYDALEQNEELTWALARKCNEALLPANPATRRRNLERFFEKESASILQQSKLSNAAFAVLDKELDKGRVEKQISLGFGHLGNGTTIWDRLNENLDTRDYVSIAHVSEEGDISWRVDDGYFGEAGNGEIRDILKGQIQDYANSVKSKLALEGAENSAPSQQALAGNEHIENIDGVDFVFKTVRGGQQPAPALEQRQAETHIQQTLSFEPATPEVVKNEAAASLSPLEEYDRIKAENSGAIVMWENGNDFEIYHEDAKTAAVTLNIAMTQRLWSGEPQVGLLTPVPRHSLGENLRKFNEAGYSVVVAAIGTNNERNLTTYPAKPPIKEIPYNVGDKLEYNGKPHEIDRIDDSFVRLRNLGTPSAYPIFDHVSLQRQNFERMLSDGELAITPSVPIQSTRQNEQEDTPTQFQYDVDKIYDYANSLNLDNRAKNRLLTEIQQKLNTAQFIGGIGRTPTAEEAKDAEDWLRERHPKLMEVLSVVGDSHAVAAANKIEQPTDLDSTYQGTPMWQDYQFLKDQNPNNLLFYRLGDFYEVMGNDARTVSEALDISLTGRDVGLDERVPMTGVPMHKLDEYVETLTNAGHIVSIRHGKDDVQTRSRNIWTASAQEQPTIEPAAVESPETEKRPKSPGYVIGQGVVLDLRERIGTEGEYPSAGEFVVSAIQGDTVSVAMYNGKVGAERSSTTHDLTSAEVEQFTVKPIAEKLHEHKSPSGNETFAYYLFRYPQELDDYLSQHPNAGRVDAMLGIDTLSLITEKADTYIICAGAAYMSDSDMQKYNIGFRKMPRDWNMLPAEVQAQLRLSKPEYEKEWIESNEIANPHIQFLREVIAEGSTESAVASIDRRVTGIAGLRDDMQSALAGLPATDDSYLGRQRVLNMYQDRLNGFNRLKNEIGEATAMIAEFRRLTDAPLPLQLSDSDFDNILDDANEKIGMLEPIIASLQPNEPQAEQPSQTQTPSYAVGDTVYLDNDSTFIIDGINAKEVTLRDPNSNPFMPSVRITPIERFEQEFYGNERNAHRFSVSEDDNLTVHADNAIAVNPYERFLKAKEKYPDHIIFVSLGAGMYANLYNEDTTHMEDAFGIDPSPHQLGDEDENTTRMEIPDKSVDYFIDKLNESGKDAVFVNSYGAMAEYKASDFLALRNRSKQAPAAAAPPKPKPTNFRMDSIDYAGVAEGGAKTKFRKNVEAIRTLKTLEEEKRTATPEEQAVLAHYVGWGGIQEAFQAHNSSWSNEYTVLKGLLSADEYEQARASVLTAYYTEPKIMGAMWDKLEQLGSFADYGNNLKAVNVLEPSMGVGNFFGTVPEHIGSTANLHGVEIDSVSGRIASQLYPNAKIQIRGFEKTQYKDDYFDVVIGNVPFSDSIKPVDWRYDKQGFLIHDYFFNKALDKVRPGGVVAFITSTGTLDKVDDAARMAMAEKAEFLGAIRLPNNAFKANAGTEVVSDIIFLQKREEPLDLSVGALPQDVLRWVKSDTIREAGRNEATDRWQPEIKRNRFFVENPHMIMGEYTEVSGRYGMTQTVMPLPGADLSEQLKEAMSHITGSIPVREIDETELDEETATKYIDFDGVRNGFFDSSDNWIDVKDSSYVVVDGEVYIRNNLRLNIVEQPTATLERIKGMVSLRDTLRELIQAQVDDAPNIEIERLQRELNTKYDTYTKNHGLLSSKTNENAFTADDSYYLLSSLEKLNDELEFEGKSDIFTKRTIKPHVEITSVNTSSEALGVSIGYTGGVDLDYMAELTGFDKEKIVKDLDGVIFKDISCDSSRGGIAYARELISRYCEEYESEYEGYKKFLDFRPYVTSDEYLSGNVREKLRFAKNLAHSFRQRDEESHNDWGALLPQFATNIDALEKAQPTDLEAHEIYVRLGTTWIDKMYIQQFMNEILDVPPAYRMELNEDGSKRHKWETNKQLEKDRITVQYSPVSNEWRVTNKNIIFGENIKADIEYGTSRINAYHIMEQTLNLKDVVVKDKVLNHEGKEVEVMNEEETTLARQKQEDLKTAFKNWIFKDATRREALVKTYNEKFNSTRPREYDGSHITFAGMNAEIKLEEHQVNAVARVMYGGNTLLAHEVGAGKSFEMIAAAMEAKRIGLCSKSLICVPKHLTGQMASEFLRLYPNANILVATDKTFEPKNRKKFCSKIATGNYDAIIMGHTQFEMIPLSVENQEKYYSEQFDSLVKAIAEAKESDSGYFTVKQMENTKNKVKAKLDNLYKGDRKDDVITFEQLGIDKMFVDEAHSYKNLHLFTKMRNVAGISQTEAQKSADMFMKCRYLDEETDSKGVIFATGTPISNSLTEMYTMMRYLQFEKLHEMGLEQFDMWASTFTEPTTELELAVEGKGYRMRTRCASFQNLPELMNTFFEVADIKTAESLNLPRPDANFHTISCEPTEMQREMIEALSIRADDVRNRRVKPHEDNMLAVTNDGRKLGLDQRVINPLLPDEPTSKINAATDNIFRIWENTKEDRLTQCVFCDLSTPSAKNKKENGFNVYDDVKKKLIERGVPPNEIAFVHDYNSDKQKQQLFAKVRAGSIRVVFGSTEKMGSGTNIQDRLVALHHLDCPWRPSDLHQREGRILRRGNQNKEIDIYKYVTKDTFDAYLYQTIEKKQQFISQIMTEKSPVRTIDDIDQSVLDYAEIKALCVGNPKIKEKMDLEQDLKKLNSLHSQYKKNFYRMENAILSKYPKAIAAKEQNIENYIADEKRLAAGTVTVSEGISPMVIDGVTYNERAKAGEALKDACKGVKTSARFTIGTYRGFDLNLSYDTFSQNHVLTLQGDMPYPLKLEGNFSVQGVVTRIDNMMDKIPEYIQNEKEGMQNTIAQMEAAKIEVAKPFPQEAEIKEKTARVAALNVELSLEAIKAAEAEERGEDALDDEDLEYDGEQPEHEETLEHEEPLEHREPSEHEEPQEQTDYDLDEQTPAEIFASVADSFGAEHLHEEQINSENIGETFEVSENGGKGAYVSSDVIIDKTSEKTSAKVDVPIPQTQQSQQASKPMPNNMIPLHLQPKLKPSQHLPKQNNNRAKSYDVAR